MAQVKYTTKQQAIGGNPIRGEISDIIGAAADKYGLDRSTMERMAQIESAGNPKAKNRRSSAGGLYQFIDSTARQYRLEDRYDPTQASDAGARLMRDNLNGLRKALGREPTAGEAYLAHQQGLKGAIALLKNPQASAVDALSTVMPKKRAEAAVRLNGDPTGRLTAGQFAGLWKGKLDNVSFKVDDKFGQLPTSSVLSNYAPMGMSFSATPGLSALRAAYDDVRTTPPAMGAAIPAYGMMAEQAAAKRPAPAPSFSLGDRVITDTPNTVGGGILNAASAIGNFASNVYARAQDAAPRPPQGVPQSPLERLRSMSISRNPFDTQQGAAAPVSPVQRSALPTQRAARPPGNFSQPARTDALSRLRSMTSAAQVNGDMRAAPGPSPAGTYAIGADSYSKQMAAQQANAKYSITSGAQPSISRNPFDTQIGTAPAQPNYGFRQLGNSTPSPLAKATISQNPFDTQKAPPKPTTTVSNVSAQGKAPTLSSTLSNLAGGLGKIAGPALAGAQKTVAQMTPKAAPVAPKPAAPKAAPSAMPTASFVSNMLGATSGILGKVGSGIMGGISALSTPTPTMNQKLAAQVEAAKAKAAAPVAKQPSTVATVGQGLANLPKANPNKINTQGLSAAITGGLGGLLTGGLPGAATGALWGYATAPSGLNPMNANMAAVPQGGLLSDGIRGMSMQRVGTAPSGAGLYSAGNEINGVKQVFNTPNPSNAFGGMGYSLGGLGSLGNMFGGGSSSKSSDSKSQSKSSGGGWGAGSSRPTGGGAGGGLKSGPYGK